MSQSFQSYLDDLHSSFACCRSASILLPTTNTKHDANDVLCKLRQWKWISEFVLIRPWVVTPLALSHAQESLPSEEELLFLQKKYALLTTTSSPPSISLISSLREQAMHNHVESKSLLVPLTDSATAFILRVFFEMPMTQIGNKGYNHISAVNTPSLVDDNEERLTIFQSWITSIGILIVHNSDGHQVVSLSKEVDSFPKPRPITSSILTSIQKQFTFVDLFAGIGGFRIGLEELGGRCVGSCEIDAFARDTYRRNFHKPGYENDEFYVNDITRLDLPHEYADIICGGFPCQSFSTMANFPSNRVGGRERSHAGNEECNANICRTNKLHPDKCRGRQGGLDTPNRGKLFFHLPRILRKSRPKLFIFENVKGLLKIAKGNHFQKILHLLEESGYHVSYSIIDTSWFLPQRRERIYFIGVRLDLFKGTGCEMNISELEWKNKYQIYGNDIINAATMDKFDRMLLQSSCHPPPVQNTPQGLVPSCLGDILESSETVINHHSHCFLTPLQWQKICKQTYVQFHFDGTGQLLTEDDACCQTLVSSYRQSYLMHSQFVVPRDSMHLLAEKKRRVESMKIKKNTGRREVAQDKTLVGRSNDLPRFFTPREWLV